MAASERKAELYVAAFSDRIISAFGQEQLYAKAIYIVFPKKLSNYGVSHSTPASSSHSACPPGIRRLIAMSPARPSSVSE